MGDGHLHSLRQGGVGTGALGLEQKDEEQGTAAVWCGSLSAFGAGLQWDVPL